jgi:L-fucose isomerase
MDGTGRQRRDGKPAMKPYWEITPQEAGACLDATKPERPVRVFGF